MDKEVVELYLDDIIPNRFQPREVFNEEALQELATSIKEHGVINPIIVRKIGDKYEIIAGERRYKATVMAGLTKIPAIIRNLDDKEASKVALLENLQRKDLTAIEEARTYQKILELDSMTQEELGRTMGKSQAAIANKMRLLSLPDEVQEALLQDRISERHARSLLNLDTSEEQVKMLNKIIENRMTVRELDNEIRMIKGDFSTPDMMSDTGTTVVEELHPKVDASISTPEESTIDDNFDFQLPTPEPNVFDSLEILDEKEDKTQSDEIKIESVPNFDSSDPNFNKIESLLKSTKNYTLKDAIDNIKNTVDKLKNKGFDIRIDEMDFENTYQVIIKIEKNK